MAYSSPAMLRLPALRPGGRSRRGTHGEAWVPQDLYGKDRDLNTNITCILSKTCDSRANFVIGLTCRIPPPPQPKGDRTNPASAPSRSTFHAGTPGGPNTVPSAIGHWSLVFLTCGMPQQNGPCRR